MPRLLLGYCYAYLLSRQGRMVQARVTNGALFFVSLLIVIQSFTWGSPLSPPNFLAAESFFPVAAILATLAAAVLPPCIALAHVAREDIFIRFADDTPSDSLLYSSEWALLSRTKLPDFETAEEAGKKEGIVQSISWSDEQSNILPLLKW